jgi:hypothetical protein
MAVHKMCVYIVKNFQIQISGERPTFFGWRRGFLHDISLLERRIKKRHLNSILAWIGSLQ